MKKHMTQEVAIKSAWMILEGLGYDRARNGDLDKTVTAVYESAPAADVVEVVRCKDCKHRFNYGICAYRGDNWFCGYGERRANN